MKSAAKTLDALQHDWEHRWEKALSHWSKYTRLLPPRWCHSPGEENQEHLQGSFAMIRMLDQAVVISLNQIKAHGLEAFSEEIMAHEIGHHVYCPADLTDNGRVLARIRAALPQRESLTPYIANLYEDLLINNYLQRSCGLDMAGVYKKMMKTSTGPAADKLWNLYMRIYEILWSLENGTLAPKKIEPMMEADARLGARVIQVYSKDWLNGAAGFAVLCYPYLLESTDPEVAQSFDIWQDTRDAGAGSEPFGLTEIDEEERRGAGHPSDDTRVTGGNDTVPETTTSPGGSSGQHREPFAYGEILKAMGINLSDHELAVRYYRERALPHLVKFPKHDLPKASDPLPEGLETWDSGMPIENVDWNESVIHNPVVIPGVTTLQRTYGESPGETPGRETIDLDLYIDCSGSMPNPKVSTSFLTLAGAIISLSALRAGASVQATLWSGARQFETTGGFVRDEKNILRIITGYLGGGTAFPIHLLRDTYQSRTKKDRPVHILVISDSGVDTMYERDEKNNSGRDIALKALANGRGGGTLALNLARSSLTGILKQMADDGWRIHRVATWEDLVAFARKFSRENYGSNQENL